MDLSLGKDKSALVGDDSAKSDCKMVTPVEVTTSAAATSSVAAVPCTALEDSSEEVGLVISQAEDGIVEFVYEGNVYRVRDDDAFNAVVAKPSKPPTRSVSTLFEAQRA